MSVDLDQLMLSPAVIEEEQGWVLGAGHQSERCCNILSQTLVWTADSAALLSVDCGVVAQASQVAGFLAPLASHGACFTHSST